MPLWLWVIIASMGEIGSTLGVIIMMNNYFHDVATGLLAASGFALWIIMRQYREPCNRETAEFFLRVYKSMTRLARFSLFWILIGGVPRTLFYRRFEWNTAVEHGQVPAIIVKHVLVFIVVGMGVHFWIKFNRKVKEIKNALESGKT
jgi:hypothetical protein